MAWQGSGDGASMRPPVQTPSGSPVPRQCSAELRRAADHLDARADVAEREALALRARAYDLRMAALHKREQAAAAEKADAGSVGVVLAIAVSIAGGLLWLAAVLGFQPVMCALHDDALAYCPGYLATDHQETTR